MDEIAKIGVKKCHKGSDCTGDSNGYLNERDGDRRCAEHYISEGGSWVKQYALGSTDDDNSFFENSCTKCHCSILRLAHSKDILVVRKSVFFCYEDGRWESSELLSPFVKANRWRPLFNSSSGAGRSERGGKRPKPDQAAGARGTSVITATTMIDGTFTVLFAPILYIYGDMRLARRCTRDSLPFTSACAAHRLVSIIWNMETCRCRCRV